MIRGLGCGTYGVGDHGREDRAVGIVAVEFADQERDHGDLAEEDDGVQERLWQKRECQRVACACCSNSY